MGIFSGTGNLRSKLPRRHLEYCICGKPVTVLERTDRHEKKEEEKKDEEREKEGKEEEKEEKKEWVGRKRRERRKKRTQRTEAESHCLSHTPASLSGGLERHLHQ